MLYLWSQGEMKSWFELVQKKPWDLKLVVFYVLIVYIWWNYAFLGEKAKLCGWLAYRRLDRFLILRDAYGLVQARIPDTRKDLQELAAGTSYESVLAVEGTVESRGENSNPQMPTGAVEVML